MRLLVGARGPQGVVQVAVETPLHPTESPERVREAAVRFFPGAEARVEPGRVVAAASDLADLRRRVWELRIIDTFRSQALHGLDADGRGFRLRLGKQAALQNKVSFPPAPHVLGDLDLCVRLEEGDRWPDAEALVWWLAPETKDGEIVGPVD